MGVGLVARRLASVPPVATMARYFATFSYENGAVPRVGPNVFLAPTSAVVGNVTIGKNSSIWYNCVLRGDVNEIRIGEETNIQDGTVIHVAKNNAKGVALPTVIGDRVTVGHMALLHACTLEDLSFVGMAATVMDGAVVKKGAMIAAGSLVTPGKEVPSGQLWGGRPAKYMRDLTQNEKDFLPVSAAKYAQLARTHILHTKPCEPVATH
mmetsp:Transcript_6803/g.14241  ORF Transcript_6803/g.14241 Transcript_6803/m.14241 type:complete len:209 (+) Transcript_6803:315-941(+)